MVYHYLTWAKYEGWFYYFFSKAGYYGVELFYVLSGFTLAMVYSKIGIASMNNVLSFYIKRVFRIFPLLWLVTLITLVLKNQLLELDVLFINLTGLFSVYRITDYIAIGAWSIGNELFFYLCFPILILVEKRWVKYSLVIILSVPFILFAFTGGIFRSNEVFNWKSFINPIGHLIMFYSGILLFQNKAMIKPKWSRFLILFVLLLFFIVPFVQRVDVVYGFQRISYSSLIIILVFASINMGAFKNRLLHGLSRKLGEASYSIYLLHPLVWGGCGYLINVFKIEWLRESNYMRIIICALLTFFIAYLVYQYYEKILVQVGKRVTNNIL